MKKLFKGTIPTIALLLVAIMSLSSLTYAWFTAGDTATVDTVDVDVKSVDGILISANGYNGTWGSSMTPDLGNDTKKLQDASSAGDLDKDGNLIFFTAKYDSKYDALVAADVATKVDSSSDCARWIQFDMYLKNEGSETKKVSINGSEVLGSALSRAVVRVAFVNAGTAIASAKVNDGQSPTTTGTNSLIGIWEPNADEHTSDGKAWLKNNSQENATKATYMAIEKAFDEASDTFVNVATGDTYKLVTKSLTFKDNSGTYQELYTINDVDANTYIYSLTSPVHFEQINIDNYFKAITSEDATDTETGKSKAGIYLKETDGYKLVTTGTAIDITKTYFTFAEVGNTGLKAYTKTSDTEGNGLKSVTTKSVDELTFEIGANTIQKITAYVWVEGQDCDCTNYVSGYPFQVALQFKKISTKQDS